VDEEIARRVTDQLSESGLETAVPIGAFKIRWPIAALVPPIHDGTITDIEVRFVPPPPPRKSCRAAELLDFAGFGRTGPDGSVSLDIREFFCGDPELISIESEDEVWAVATPRSSEAAYLTHLVLGPAELPGPLPPTGPIRIRFFAWDNAGQPKADVSFTWRVLLHGGFLVG
jgi:hypothetical protein